MGGDGAPLLLLHGIPGSSQSWQKVGVKLAGRYRVIIPDLLGFGASDAPTNGFYLDEQADAIRGLLNYLQVTRCYLGGHGFGGLLALTLMQRYPELDIRGLILAAADLLPDAHPPLPLRLAQLPGLGPLVAWSITGNWLGLRLFYTALTHNQEEARWRDFRRHLTRPSLALTRRILLRAATERRTRYAQFEAMLPQIDCPTLLLWGDEDPLSRVIIGEQLRALLPDALLKVYAYTGHFIPEERPLETAEDIVLRFHDQPLVIKRAA